jgi:hypothetical protein
MSRTAANPVKPTNQHVSVDAESLMEKFNIDLTFAEEPLGLPAQARDGYG